LFAAAVQGRSRFLCMEISVACVAQGIFTLCKINQKEWEMCNYLDWELTVDNPILSNFEAMVQRDFPLNSKGCYPTYSFHMVLGRAAKAAASARGIQQ
ncbi:hypothetical protein DFH07DRAFT_728006, partial [Mycena maculata]